MVGLLENIELFGQNIPWLEALREEGRSLFALPGAKTEAWKYTKLHDLRCRMNGTQPQVLEHIYKLCKQFCFEQKELLQT